MIAPFHEPCRYGLGQHYSICEFEDIAQSHFHVKVFLCLQITAQLQLEVSKITESVQLT